MGSGMSPRGRSGALMFLLRYKCTPRLPYQENVSANPLGRLFSKEIEASVVYGSTKSGTRVRCDIGIDEILPYRNGSGNDGREITICRSEEHTSELQSRLHLVCRLLLEKKKRKTRTNL